MAQSTPTHASGFHLVTVAMTGHAQEMGSTTDTRTFTLVHHPDEPDLTQL